MERRGAHAAENIVDSNVDIEKIYDWHSNAQHVKIVTLAPELPGALEAIEKLSATCTVCLGHTSTRLATAERAVGCGARGITHLFNAMLPYHHRDPTLLGLLAGRNIPAQVHYGIIADGLHTHDSALSIAYRTHPSGLVLVSDAISALGMGDGLHQLGTAKILVDGNKATVADAPLTPLAGSVTPLDECVRHFREAVHCSPAAAVQCATEHPATLLGIKNERGNLAPGCRADLVLLDDELNVRATFIAGRLVWPVKED